MLERGNARHQDREFPNVDRARGGRDLPGDE